MTLTITDWFGAILYIATAMVAVHAARRVPASTVRENLRLHWLAIAALFVGLAIWRLADAEQRLQDRMRAMLVDSGEYAGRWDMQAIVFIALLVAGLLACFWTVRIWQAHRSYRMVSSAASLTLLGFTAIRLLSFHPIDRLLYSGIGPFRLNYLVEGILILAVWYGARQYLRDASWNTR